MPMNTDMEQLEENIYSGLFTFYSPRIFALYIILLVLNLQGKMQQKTGRNVYDYDQEYIYIYI